MLNEWDAVRMGQCKTVPCGLRTPWLYGLLKVALDIGVSVGDGMKLMGNIASVWVACSLVGTS